MQPIQQFKFSSGFDKLDEELRTYEGLVKTYLAIFGEAISDSITQAVIKSQMPAEIRTHLELQTFARTTSHVKAVQDENSGHQFKLGRTWSDADGNRLGQPARVRARARIRRKGQAKARAKERAKKNPRARSSMDGVITVENGSQSCKLLAWKRETGAPKYKVQLVQPA